MSQILLRVQKQMLACLAVGETFEHPSAGGAASEQGWIDLFNRYLPQRYRASSAFVVDADGRRSCQIDIAIYDNLYSPLIFPHDSGLHIAAESAYAIFEVKQALTRQLIRDAGRKAERNRAQSDPVGNPLASKRGGLLYARSGQLLGALAPFKPTPMQTIASAAQAAYREKRFITSS